MHFGPGKNEGADFLRLAGVHLGAFGRHENPRGAPVGRADSGFGRQGLSQDLRDGRVVSGHDPLAGAALDAGDGADLAGRLRAVDKGGDQVLIASGKLQPEGKDFVADKAHLLVGLRSGIDLLHFRGQAVRQDPGAHPQLGGPDQVSQ